MYELTPAEVGRLADYFAGSLGAHQTAEFERWLDAAPHRRSLIVDLRRTRLELRDEATDALLNMSRRSDAVLRNLSVLRASAPVKKRGTGSWGQRRVGMWPTVAFAVASVLAAFVGWRMTPSGGTVASTAVATYATGRGERAAITLPDGSHVQLNVDSRVQIPVDFAKGNRRVVLQGAALFSVAHREGAPFTVVAGSSVTRVLGTRFVVRHYPTDSVATVAVQDGKVSVQSHVLTAAQQISVGPRGTSAITPVGIAPFVFASGALLIDDRPLPEAIPELNRWYNVDVRLGDPGLSRRRVFGQFREGSLTDLVDVLERMFDVRVVRSGRILTLYPKG